MKKIIFVLLVFNLLSCSKKQNNIATYVHYKVSEKKFDFVLWNQMGSIESRIVIYYLENLKILNDSFNVYSFITGFELRKNKNRIHIPENISNKFKDDSPLGEAIALAREKNARLLLVIKPEKVNSSKIYNIHFTVFDIEDNFKKYKIKSFYKVDRRLLEGQFKSSSNNKKSKVDFLLKDFHDFFGSKDKSRNEILKELTEIIKKTEK